MQANGVNAAPATDRGAPAPSDAKGKHRISAELKRLEQEARFLEEEISELEKIEKVSASLHELLLQVESRRDPLLPETTGSTSTSWDRWFEGPQDTPGCRCWVFWF
ncbi:guanine nucleotide-binding protein subunit gamma 1-like [Musa acuminata AAA Group]|uniref:guanine nucleotide-binding protein subunit gamma 1-like n=1 Tax=Musa acuminata AAA Group TaxID=214697 RepID=UPI0031D639F3